MKKEEESLHFRRHKLPSAREFVGGFYEWSSLIAVFAERFDAYPGRGYIFPVRFAKVIRAAANAGEDHDCRCINHPPRKYRITAARAAPQDGQLEIADARDLRAS